MNWSWSTEQVARSIKPSSSSYLYIIPQGKQRIIVVLVINSRHLAVAFLPTDDLAAPPHLPLSRQVNQLPYCCDRIER